MEPLSVCIAALFQLLGVSIFIKQPEDQCSPAPTLGHWLFLLATLYFMWDTNIYPLRYMHMPKHWQVIFEVIAGVFLLEIFTLVIWCSLEYLVFITTRKLLLTFTNKDCMSWALEYWLQGLSTSAVSGTLLWFILDATDARCSGSIVLRRLKRNWKQFWRTLQDIRQMSSAERRRALRACRMATQRKNRCRQPKQESEDDDEEEEDEDEDEY